MTDVMNHTCFRIKDPKVSIPFYTKNFNMKLVDEFSFPKMKFTIYMLVVDSPSNSDSTNWAKREGVLELCHNWGSESDDSFKLANGNEDPYKGFGHICFSVPEIASFEEKLLSNNVSFKKKLSDGRQKNIAFALDPDNYWIELIESSSSNINFNHTMIRVKDPKKSLEFYEKLGFKLLVTKKFDEAKFTLYFLGITSKSTSELKDLDDISQFQGLIELTHNWGTEDDKDFSYHNGNSGDVQGYGHTCVSLSDPEALCKRLEKENLDWSVKYNQGSIKGIAFVRDPDGYSIEIISHDLFKNGNDEYKI